MTMHAIARAGRSSFGAIPRLAVTGCTRELRRGYTFRRATGLFKTASDRSISPRVLWGGNCFLQALLTNKAPYNLVGEQPKLCRLASGAKL